MVSYKARPGIPKKRRSSIMHITIEERQRTAQKNTIDQCANSYKKASRNRILIELGAAENDDRN